MKPIVSVVIPVYNDEKYIRESVKSALNQDYENLEIIVVDDGSSDFTPKILKKFGERIHYIRQENRGTAAALNKGIRRAKGQLIAWLSSDDLFLPKKIKLQVEKFLDNPFFDLIYTDWIMIDSLGQEVKTVHCTPPSPEHFVIKMLDNNFINGSSVLIRRECFDNVGYFDETLLADSDGDMWFRMLKYGCHFSHIPIPLVKYRWHSGNLSHKYKIAESCRNRVRFKALQTFSPNELFSDINRRKVQEIDSQYEKLALIFARQWLFLVAELAITKSIGSGFSLKRRILKLVFRTLKTEPLATFLLMFRKLRFWLLAH